MKTIEMRAAGLALISIALAAGLSNPLGHWLYPAQGWELTYEQRGGSDDGDSESPSQRIQKNGNGLDLEYGFLSFERDRLLAKFHLNAKDIQDSYEEFGYLDNDLDRLGGDNQAEFFMSKGFKLLRSDTVSADIPALVQSNYPRLLPLALEFERIRKEHEYGPWDTIGAVTAMVQTSVVYQVPPRQEGDKHIGGVLPPPVALARGWGDCDTKSAILGAIMSNWDGVYAVGVGLPGHYLIGIQGVPSRGDAYLERKGSTYVLIEAAGPAWSPPGNVSEQTLAKLSLTQGVSIEPFWQE